MTDKTYPCQKCGALRTAAEGGTTFTVCDECWDKQEIVTARARQAKRDRKIGPSRPRER